MRSVTLATARVMVLCYAAVMAGCGGPQSGDQVKVTPEETQKRTQGIKEAMKAGMYNNPNAKKAAPANK
jgi:hypothetical protein